jgi:hypothetical protein
LPNPCRGRASVEPLGSASTRNLHPDFGPPKDYGIPFDVVTNAQPTIPVKFLNADESDPGPYPFGSDIQSRGAPTATR